MTKYIGCLPIEDWAVIVAAFYMILSFIHITYVATDVYLTMLQTSISNESLQEDFILCCIRILLESLVFMTSMILIFSRSKRRPALALPWMIFVGTFDGLMFILATLRIGYFMQDERLSGEAAMAIYSIFRGGLTACCMSIVHSFRCHLLKQESRKDNSIEEIQESSFQLISN